MFEGVIINYIKQVSEVGKTMPTVWSEEEKRE